MNYDLLITKADLLDGSGSPARRASVAVAGGRIAAVGELPGATARRVIDGEGLTLCPGFIDIHGHSDLTLLANPRAESKVHMGVTTECNGQCGMGVFPVRPEHCRMLDDTCAFISAEVPYDWATTAEYLARLQAARPALNVAAMAGHSALRACVMGFDNRPATADEIDALARLTRQTLAEGAVGVSLGLAYALGSFATTDELEAICGAIATMGGHVSVHPRSEGAHQAQGLHEVFNLARAAAPRGVLRVQIDHLKCSGPGNWGQMAQALSLIEQARDEGLDVAFDVYPYIAGSRHLSGSLPAWMHSGGNDALLQRLQDPACRDRLQTEHDDWVAGRGGESPFELRPEDILVTSVDSEANRWAIGLRLSEVADRRRQAPLAATMDLLVEEKGRVSVCLFSMHEADMELALTHPLACIATDGLAFAPYGSLSRGNPHPRSYGTYPRLLGHYVRERGLLTLPEAVRKCTSWPAERLQLTDRGVLRPGYWADLVLFNPATITDKATYTDPHRYPEGIELVVVNGEITVEDDQHTGAGAGQLVGPGR